MRSGISESDMEVHDDGMVLGSADYGYGGELLISADTLEMRKFPGSW